MSRRKDRGGLDYTPAAFEGSHDPPGFSGEASGHLQARGWFADPEAPAPTEAPPDPSTDPPELHQEPRTQPAPPPVPVRARTPAQRPQQRRGPPARPVQPRQRAPKRAGKTVMKSFRFPPEAAAALARLARCWFVNETAALMVCISRAAREERRSEDA